VDEGMGGWVVVGDGIVVRGMGEVDKVA